LDFPPFINFVGNETWHFAFYAYTTLARAAEPKTNRCYAYDIVHADATLCGTHAKPGSANKSATLKTLVGYNTKIKNEISGQYLSSPAGTGTRRHSLLNSKY
jgi:hypothetical protein